MQTAPAVFSTNIRSLPLIQRGKVRDLYAVGSDHILMIATDRLSAFDVILPRPLPGKGRLLTEISQFWFEYLRDVSANHLSDLRLRAVLPDPDEYAQAEGRSMIVKRLAALPVEAVVRGYLAGSGWRDYQRSGQVCGLALPAGLRLGEQLPEPVFTPASKAGAGAHDENISFASIADTIGASLAAEVRRVSLALYRRATDYARIHGIIIADTKFEFGLDSSGDLILMDEVLTPDSSRFWPAGQWRVGQAAPSMDKQLVRDYLETLDWNKTPPGPELPDAVMHQTLAKYVEITTLLTKTALLA